MSYIYWIEQDDKHYLSIGNKAPWLNGLWIRVPLFIARLFVVQDTQKGSI